MDVGQMSAEQVAEALHECNGGWQVVQVTNAHDGDVEPAKEWLVQREAELLARQAVVGKPVRGVSLDVALASDRDSLRQCLQGVLAFFESEDYECGESLDRGPVRQALRRSDELGAKWEPREVEAVELARQNGGLRFEAAVAHGALRRIVEADVAFWRCGLPEGEHDAAYESLQAAINAAREIVGGGK